MCWVVYPFGVAPLPLPGKGKGARQGEGVDERSSSTLLLNVARTITVSSSGEGYTSEACRKQAKLVNLATTHCFLGKVSSLGEGFQALVGKLEVYKQSL